MRKLKEGDYFAPKNEEEYAFILKSLGDLGYDTNELISDYFDIYPFITLSEGNLNRLDVSTREEENLITLHDLFTEEVGNFKLDQKVLVRDFETEPWEYDRYGRYENEDEYPHKCIGNSWKFCIDYETNKEKHGKI